jgi:dihydrofolate reductase
MRKVVLSMSVSLDGFIEGPDHDIGWHQVDDELLDHFNRRLSPLGAFLHGRVLYELMAAYWPTADADPAAPRQVTEFAAIWRDKPKIVYSRTLEHVDWNSTIVRDVVPAEVRALKEQPGGDLGLGGADLAAAFLRQDLVDEIQIYVHPVLVGRGKRLFPAADGITMLRLAESRTFGNGVVMLHYVR